ncbi:uncharacterized protein MYCGRDRAFT_90331 [Zymoseptoria tritici IPO323]|uniref:DUF7730 domain-containing protein n=1 Tax=Zymoseptoria tritici (strain CBS 115943 / IPO323) TaxID=336722 RepID=F9X1X9_ZYMTI|nr:uncharacterized protein MYCGRDRAFT_90331 [Zymoseptoria tritici IPO323]EGP89674.1 hypothetical protein MYCGRDRAFT_90331 [Zymoseptoria tritici IPO323]
MLSFISTLFASKPRTRGCVAYSAQPEVLPPVLIRDLPSSRRRSTISDTPEDERHLQEQSLLLTRLPIDIRVLIWELVIGPEHDEVLHLSRSTALFDTVAVSRMETRVFLRFGTLAGKSSGRRGRGRYRESINLLYQSNTFDFREVEAVTRLPRIILPQRLQHIRRIHFSTAFQVPFLRHAVYGPHIHILPDDFSQWSAACRIFASFPALHELRVTIAIWHADPDRREDDEEALMSLLEPLKAALLLLYFQLEEPDDDPLSDDVFGILRNTLQPDSELPLETAVQQITALLLDARLYSREVPSTPAEDPSKYVNFQAFAAQLCKRGMIKGHRLAVWTSETALDSKKVVEPAERNAYVQAAANWFLIYGDGIFTAIGAQEWQGWKGCLEQVVGGKWNGKSCAFNQETRLLAGKAVAVMIAVEG